LSAATPDRQERRTLCGHKAHAKSSVAVADFAVIDVLAVSCYDLGVIVSLHVASGAAAAAAMRSRTLAVLCGPALHLAGDRVPHRDIPNRRFEVASGLLCVTLLALRRGFLNPVTVGALSAAAPDLEHLFPVLRPGGSKLFHGSRGWHRSGRLPVAAQLLLAGAIVGALAAPTRSPS